jgi:large subunit ribosomal protein L25
VLYYFTITIVCAVWNIAIITVKTLNFKGSVKGERFMVTLKAENRDSGLKPRQLRRKGIIPAVVYGKDLDESLSIQFAQSEIAQFLKANSTGSRAELEIDGKKLPTLLREITYVTATSNLEHLSFQKLVAGEIVSSTAMVVIQNREKVSGVVHLLQGEIAYQALPAHLIDRIEIDLEGAQVGDSFRISDLEIAKNENIEILSPLDTMLVSISDIQRQVETTDEAGEAEAVETEEE